MNPMGQICRSTNISKKVTNDPAREEDEYDSFGGVYLGPPDGNVDNQNAKLEETVDVMANVSQVHVTNAKADSVASNGRVAHQEVTNGGVRVIVEVHVTSDK